MAGESSKPDNRLPRERRLSNSADFARIKDKGERVVLGAIIANWQPNELEDSRLGVIASARMGKAHERSRAKRLLRESFRLNRHRLREGVDLVLIARNSIKGKTFSAVEENFLAILKRAKLLREK